MLQIEHIAYAPACAPACLKQHGSRVGRPCAPDIHQRKQQLETAGAPTIDDVHLTTLAIHIKLSALRLRHSTVIAATVFDTTPEPAMHTMSPHRSTLVSAVEAPMEDQDAVSRTTIESSGDHAMQL